MENSNLPIKIDFEGVGKLSEPITKLIEVISCAVGKVYEPTYIVRKAKADLKSKVITELSELISNEIQHRGFKFFISQLEKKQLNIEKIINKSIKYLPAELSDPNMPNEGWILDFFDLSQNCTDDDIQELWGKLLADEVDNPGSHSRRLMHTLKVMAPFEAKFFKNASEFRCRVYMRKKNLEKILKTDVTDNEAIIISVNDDIIFGGHLGLDYEYDQLMYFEEIGLFNRLIFWGNEDGAEIYKLDFNGDEINVKDAVIEIFEFTALGTELLNISMPNYDSRYREYVDEKLLQNNMKL
ncbi:MAG: DUF2806 domain-containing protein [Marinifilaceae bacterium]